MEAQIAKANVKGKGKSKCEKEKKSWGYHNSRLQGVLQSHNHQDNMVLAQKQTHRSTEQYKEPRNGPTIVWTTNLQQMVLGKLDSYRQKNETGPLSYTTHKSKLKMD